MTVCHQCRAGMKYEILYQWLMISGGPSVAATEKIIHVRTNIGRKAIGIKAVAISSTDMSHCHRYDRMTATHRQN